MAGRGPLRPNVRLWDARDRYLARIKAEGHAETSIKTIGYSLTRLCNAIDSQRRNSPNPYIHTISPSDMDDYCYGRNGIRVGGGTGEGRPVTAQTFNRYRQCLKSFFDYAVDMGWTDQNPVKAVSPARPEPPSTKLFLSATELLQLLEQCRNPVERIGCAVGMNTGLRGNDIRRLTIFDANVAGGDLQTEIRKTAKIDNKPISLDLHFELMRWLEKYAELMQLDSLHQLRDNWLLVPSYKPPAPSARNRQISLRPNQIHTNPWRLVQRPLERLGFPTKGQGFHTLRRSSARALFESLREAGDGRDHALMIVKEFLNHSSVMQTEKYLGLNQERAIRDSLIRGKPFLSKLAQQESERVDSLNRAVGSG